MKHRKGFFTPKKVQAVDPLFQIFQSALAFHQQGNLSEAKRLYDELLILNPKHFDALYMSGVIAYQVGYVGEAERFFSLAVGIKPDHADAFYNRGITLHELKRFDEALASYEKAISIKSDYAAAFNNRGNTLADLKRYDEALANYDKAIAIKPDYADAFNNRGNTLHELKRFDEALASYDKAIAIKPDFADAFNNCVNTLTDLKRYDEALASYEKAITIKPDYEYLFGFWLYIKMMTSDWSNSERLLNELQVKIRDIKSVTPPFPVLALFDDCELSSIAARQWMDQKFPSNPIAAPFEKERIHSKKRLGYFSADFHDHATAHLMAELFERHDRNRFELYAFSFGPKSEDGMRQRLEASFDSFIDVRFQSDQEVAALSRTLGIDIAIDLKGITNGARPGIFAHRCARVQVNYIGYPGTMAADYIDYMIADQIVIPVKNQLFYSEKIVYLPGSYQANDSKREISNKEFTRSELGLPPQGFVFCCFNNSYKILPAVFDSWMRILKAVDASVLWLLDDNDTSTRNLKREASNRGISPERLVFGKRMPLAEHLARHRCADLFLDTHPCNAHTTASDALWAGLPVLTRIGESFAARVAGSLLSAVGLPELITNTTDEYEQLAIRLATHRDEIQALKHKLAHQRLSSKLFDTASYVRHLEAAYTRMYERDQAGLEPDHIYIEDQAMTLR